jgi:hypothetical protein
VQRCCKSKILQSERGRGEHGNFVERDHGALILDSECVED